MTLIEIIQAFTFYGLDAIVLAVATCLLTQLLKITIFKNCQRKVITFLPFLIGGILYFFYFTLAHLSFKATVENLATVFEHGFSVGTLATVAYVGYEQLIRGEKNIGATHKIIAALIEGYVPDDSVENVALQICRAIERDVTGDGADKAEKILLACGGQLSEKDAKLLAKLIIETLAHMVTQA